MSIDNEIQFKSMQKIGAIVANCLEYIKSQVRPGITTKELDDLAFKFLSQFGAVSAPKSSYNFPGTICISVEKEAAHGIPGSKVLREGDLINIDVSAHLDGYFADNGESFVVGKGPKIKKKLCRVVQEALSAALEVARANVRIADVGRTVQDIAKRNKLTVIENLGGHGVGLSLHEEPEFIPSFYDRNDKRVFQENTVVAIEPFVSNGARYVKEAKDGWTLFHDQFYSAQKEHTVMITQGRPYIFTRPNLSFS